MTTGNSGKPEARESICCRIRASVSDRGVKLRHSLSNKLFGKGASRQCTDLYAGEIVDGSGLSGKKVVTCSFAPFLIALGKNVFGKAVDAFKMPKFTHEVNPFS